MSRIKRIAKKSKESIKKLLLCLIFQTAVFAPAVFSQAPQSRPVVVRGEVRDQHGAFITGAGVRLIEANGKTEEKILSDRQGAFRFERLVTGNYILQISAAGFADYEGNFDLRATDEPKKISVVLYPTVKVDVEVSENAEIPLDAERAAGTHVLSAKELENLPDDPDALSEQLQNLAASSGGVPGGAVVTVDGFLSGGKLPPKSAIRQVRINPNLYSAEYNTPPFQGGRVEIITKPGSSKFSGSAFYNYNRTFLNARDPFALTRARTNTNRYGFNFGAPIIKNRAGFFFDLERRDITEAGTVNAIVLDENFQTVNFIANIPNPRRLMIGSARADWQINQTNTVVFRYDFNQNKLINQGVGGLNLAERGFDSNQTENSFRLTETSVLNPRTVNELRAGFTFNRIEQIAPSRRPSIIVAGSFASGGANVQDLSRDEKRLEITDHLTTETGKHNLKFGAQIFNKRIGEVRAENTNGSFFFGGATLPDGTRISSLEQYRRALLGLPGGSPTGFSLATGAPQVSVNQWLFASFAQDEWKLSPKVSVSLGFRYESQTSPDDSASFAPRMGIAIAPDKKQQWTFRARAGVFYERIDDALTLETKRLDGIRQRQIIIDSPSFPNPFAGGIINNAIPTVRIFDPNLQPPASLQLRIELERQLPQGWKILSSYSRAFGWNRLRSRNVNAPVVSSLNPNPPAAPRPFSILENILQFESSGRLRGRTFYFGVNQNANKFFSVNAGYLNLDFLTDADSAFALPQSSYDFSGEWARPVWQNSHRVFISSTFNLPEKLRLSASFNAVTGAPYNVTTGRDNNGDGNFNDRPDESFSGDSQAVPTIFGFLNPNRIGGNLRRNIGTNPATATLDLNLSRVFSIGKEKGGGGGGESRYKLAVNIRAANALNRTNPAGTSSVLPSPFFGRPTTANPARRIEFGARFSF